MASADTRQRRRERAAHRRQRLLKSRRESLPVYASLGLDAAIRGIPQTWRQMIYAHPGRALCPQLDPAAAGIAGAAHLAEHLVELMTELRIRVPIADVTPPPAGIDVNLTDFWSVLWPTWIMLHALAKEAKLRPHELAAFKAVMDVPMIDLMVEADDLFQSRLWVWANYCSRINDGICWVESRPVQVQGKRQQHEVMIHAEPARKREFHIPGTTGTRPAFHVGGCYAGQVHWAHWPAELLGLPADHPPLPVFLQSHALHRMFDRLPIGHESAIHLQMVISLCQPKIQKREPNGNIWVECTCPDGPLGYFVGDVIDGAVLIRSFLFLTMQGTPQHRALSKRLKMQQRDLEYLELDQFRTYLHSDLGDDPVLSRILTECGLAHLMTLRKLFPPPDGKISEHAAFVRKYLGLAGKKAA